jgi:hypothetical protein
MMLAPRDDIVEIVARRDGHAGQQKKHFSQGIGDLCLLKSRKGREGLEIFVPPPYHRGHDHNSCRPRSAPGKTIASTEAADLDKTAPNFQQRNKSELRVPAPFQAGWRNGSPVPTPFGSQYLGISWDNWTRMTPSACGMMPRCKRRVFSYT